MEKQELKNILEAALMAAGKPLDLDRLALLFPEDRQPDQQALRSALQALETDYGDRGIELVEVGSGYRIQSRPAFSEWVSRLWEERPSRYTRALLETLALVAYRQPVTRAEIEDVRGVSVSTSIMRTLLEREWVRIVGYRDVPGKPGMYATTRKFLDYFGLKSLDDLPTLAELRDILELDDELGLDGDTEPGEVDAGEAADDMLADEPAGSGDNPILQEAAADGMDPDVQAGPAAVAADEASTEDDTDRADGEALH